MASNKFIDYSSWLLIKKKLFKEIAKIGNNLKMSIDGILDLKDDISVNSVTGKYIYANEFRPYNHYSENTSSNKATQWFKICDLRIDYQYGDSAAKIFIFSGNDGGVSCYHGTIVARLKQQTPMGGTPYFVLYLDTDSNFDEKSLKAVISTNSTSETNMQIWANVPAAYMTFWYNLEEYYGSVFMAGNGSPLQANEPTGAYQKYASRKVARDSMKLNGYSESGGADGNTIARRDSNGALAVTLLNASQGVIAPCAILDNSTIPYTGTVQEGWGNTLATGAPTHPSFIGSVYVDNAWHNVISVRHRNGAGDGNEYGLLIYNNLTSAQSLIWRQQYGNNWQPSRTILDSANYTNYAAPKSHQHTNKVLWSNAWYMNAGQTATLSEAISAQPTGVVLVWSSYTDGTAHDYDFYYTFIPKFHVTQHGGKGIDVGVMSSTTFSYIATKYVYVHDTKIVGNKYNDTTGSNNGVTFINNHMVLRYVIGV